MSAFFETMKKILLDQCHVQQNGADLNKETKIFWIGIQSCDPVHCLKGRGWGRSPEDVSTVWGSHFGRGTKIPLVAYFFNDSKLEVVTRKVDEVVRAPSVTLVTRIGTLGLYFLLLQDPCYKIFGNYARLVRWHPRPLHWHEHPEHVRGCLLDGQDLRGCCKTEKC